MNFDYSLDKENNSIDVSEPFINNHPWSVKHHELTGQITVHWYTSESDLKKTTIPEEKIISYLFKIKSEQKSVQLAIIEFIWPRIKYEAEKLKLWEENT